MGIKKILMLAEIYGYENVKEELNKLSKELENPDVEQERKLSKESP